MNPSTKVSTYQRALAGAFVLFNFTNMVLAADWKSTGIADPTNGAAPGLWNGVTNTVALLYAIMWLGSLILMGFCWFEWKKGDTKAAFFSITGGAGLGITPFLVQYFRNF